MTKDEALKLALEALTYIYTETTDELIDEALTAIKEALEQPEQEPQIAINSEIVSYVAPQREWVGLTDDEICKLEGFYDFMTKEDFFDAIRKVEAKLKEKNT